MPEVGEIALIFNLCFSFFIVSLPYKYQLQLKDKAVISNKCITLQMIMITCSVISLIVSCINKDFSLLYVYQHVNIHLPLIYRITALWGGHEGSILLWLFVLQIWLFIFNKFQHTESHIIYTVNTILSWQVILFSIYILWLSNPFLHNWFFAYSNGLELNPLLQDHAMLIHPPLLYVGYVGTAIPFAIGIFMLKYGINSYNINLLKKWSLLSFIFLTAGIGIGSYWSYYELGWGGYWFWDPVENASFMPWIILSAIIHLSSSCRQKFTAKWLIFLSSFAFLLSIIGTFLVRSGIISSVHAFASDSERGLYILAVVCIWSIYISFTLIFNSIKNTNNYRWQNINIGSKEYFICCQSIIMFCIAISILFGTLYPVILSNLHIANISVGAPYFNNIFVPMMLCAIILMIMSIRIPWQKSSIMIMYKKNIMPLILSIIMTSFVQILNPINNYVLLLIIFIAIYFSINSYLAVRENQYNLSKLLQAQGAHLGIILIMLGITCVSCYEQKLHIKLAINDHVELANYNITLQKTNTVKNSNHRSFVATLAVKDKSNNIFYLKPAKNFYFASKIVTAEAGIYSLWNGDLYAQIGEQFADDSLEITLFYKPMICLLWLGALIIIISVLLNIISFIFHYNFYKIFINLFQRKYIYV